MKKKYFFKIASLGLFIPAILFFNNSVAQRGKILEQVKDRTQNIGRPGQTASADSLGFQHRDDLADSVNISYRYLDSLRNIRMESSLNDFNKYFSVPANYITLGNNGSPAYPLLYSPILKAGWDAGFHAYDVYRFTIENNRFFRTTKPYTDITYLLASGKEQLIHVLHTQNIKSNWNAGFEYRLISAPGFLQTQNVSHNNYRLFSNYQSKHKRYAAYFILNGNHLAASANGGINNKSKLDSFKLFSVPVNLGGNVEASFNPFSTKIATGNIYQEFSFFLRQSYDLGKKDSIQINDSTKEYLFYPKFRFQHTIRYDTYEYIFKDTLSIITYAKGDSAIFKQWYDTALNVSNGLNFLVSDRWKILSNDFSVIQFPETKNPAQFIQAGLTIENLKGIFSKGSKSYYNVMIHGEYRNKTRNRLWDALLKGEFYTVGLNSGDFSAYAVLTRFLNQRFGNVQLSFQNVSRTPSFIFNSLSSYNFKNASLSKKENTTVLSAATENPAFTLWFRNISITNYSYLKNYYQADQYSSLINISQIEASKKLRFNAFRKKLYLYSDFILQQSGANSPIKLPFFYTRQRLAFEGVFFKNLNLSTGLDVSYNSPFKMNHYSPVMGRFFSQDTVTINNLPSISYFFDFRIKTFTGLVRIENLNTVTVSNGFGFTNYNFTAPSYPTPGLILRIGVKWTFVN